MAEDKSTADEDAALNLPEPSDKKIRYEISKKKCLSKNEMTTIAISFCTLAVAIATFINSLDTKQLERAISNISELAKQTKREADTDSDLLNVQASALDLQRNELASTKKSANALGQQADAAQRSADIARRSLEENNRPIFYISLTDDPKPNAFAFHIIIANAGNRLGFLEHAWVSIFFNPFDGPKTPLDEPQDIRQTCVTLGELVVPQNTGVTIPCSIPQSEYEVAGIMNASRRVYVTVAYSYHAADGIRWLAGRSFFYQSQWRGPNNQAFSNIMAAPNSNFDKRTNIPLFATSPDKGQR